MNEYKRSQLIYLSFIIPVYNGESRIAENVKKTIEYLKDQNYTFEVILIDDGSLDNTDLEIKKLEENIPHVRPLFNERNRGKGFSIRKGILASQGNYILYTDADIAYPLFQVKNLLRGLEDGYDIVVGSRAYEESRFILSPRDFRYIYQRHLIGRIFNLFVRSILIEKIRDTQSGFKGFKRQAAKDLFSKQQHNDFSFDVEVLFLAQKSGYRIKEIPVVVEYSGEPSSVMLLRDSLRMFWAVWQIKWNYLRGRYRLN
jgi:dolichyl-phosphate beta-glucosyltransferase